MAEYKTGSTGRLLKKVGQITNHLGEDLVLAESPARGVVRSYLPDAWAELEDLEPQTWEEEAKSVRTSVQHDADLRQYSVPVTVHVRGPRGDTTHAGWAFRVTSKTIFVVRAYDSRITSLPSAHKFHREGGGGLTTGRLSRTSYSLTQEDVGRIREATGGRPTVNIVKERKKAAKDA